MTEALAEPGKLTLRVATVADLPGIMRIEHATFAGETWSESAMRDELESEYRHYLALVDDAQTVYGYGGLLAVGPDGDIQTIAIDASARGTGQGRRIMAELLAEATRRDVERIFLEVRGDNTVAQKLYESLGFEQIGVRPGYYQPGNVDAIVMRLEMTGK